MKIPTSIKKQKDFVYTSNKNLKLGPLGKEIFFPRRKWIWIRDQYRHLKEKIAHTNEEYSRSPVYNYLRINLHSGKEISMR